MSVVPGLARGAAVCPLRKAQLSPVVTRSAARFYLAGEAEPSPAAAGSEEFREPAAVPLPRPCRDGHLGAGADSVAMRG